jgi:Protein of unknown function (DUF2905)
MRKILLIAGSVLILAGLAWPWLRRLPFGQLPGDIAIERPGLRVYVPWVSMLALSLVLSLLLRIFRR